jgi:hypothetical protein
MDSTVIFSGLFRAFTSLVLAIHAPEMGLTVSGTIVPTGSGLAYRIATSLSWGTSDLLPTREGDTGKICTGDVCF